MIVLQGRRGEGCFPFSQLVQVRSFFFRGDHLFFLVIFDYLGGLHRSTTKLPMFRR